MGVKFSQLPEDTSPTSDDLVAVLDKATSTTKVVTLANLVEGGSSGSESIKKIQETIGTSDISAISDGTLTGATVTFNNRTQFATTSVPGIIKPDGTTVAVDSLGTLSVIQATNAEVTPIITSGTELAKIRIDADTKSIYADIPRYTSEITNDSGYITKAVSDLENYYLKSSTYTKIEVDSLISAIPKFSIKIVDELPLVGEPATIYLLKNKKEEDGNLYTEYIYIDGQWEELGTQTLDLSDYYKKAETDEAIKSKAKNAYFSDTQTIQQAISSKVDSVGGKGLSTNDYSNEDQAKVNSVETGAQVNKLESISLNGLPQTIDSSKNVNLTVIQDTDVSNMISENAKNAVYDSTSTIGQAIASKTSIAVTPMQTTGTEIAKLNVDGTEMSLYAPGAEGQVSVTPTLSSGTQIASINVSGKVSELFAPNSTEVAVNPAISEGSEIGSISVNGEKTTLYSEPATDVKIVTQEEYDALPESKTEDDKIYLIIE